MDESEQGDSACWLDRTCPRCGAYVEPGIAHACASGAHAPARVLFAPTTGSTGLAGDDLNATIVNLGPGQVLPAARTDREIAVVVLRGSGTLRVWERDEQDAQTVSLTAGALVLVPAAHHRAIMAGEDGLRWTSLHVRRERVEPLLPPSSSRASR